MQTQPSSLDDMAQVFDALGHSSRRRILDLLRAEPALSVGALAGHFETSRIGVMHHLRKLEACGLVISRKEGRVRRLYFNPVPIQLIYDRWTGEYGGFWASKMADVKYAVETRTSAGGDDDRAGEAGVEGPHPRPDRGRVA